MRVKTVRFVPVLAAIAVGVLASPVMAQNWRYANIPVSTDNVFWGLALAPLQASAYGMAYGSLARIPPGRPVPGVTAPPPGVAAPLPRILDCVHVTFPQCSGN